MSDIQLVARKLTVDEFLTWVESQPEGVRFELHRGELVEMSPSKAMQTVIAARITALLVGHAEAHGLGVVGGADAGFFVSQDDFYAPDASFFGKARLPEGIPQDDYFRVAPDLAVEVVSTSDEFSAHRKAQRYIEIGVRMVWVVYPKLKSVDVYTPSDGGVLVRQHKVGDTLDGGAVLPGFSVPVARVMGD